MNLNNILGQQSQPHPQQQSSQSLKNINQSNFNNLNNFQNLTSPNSSYDTLGLLILIAMLIKACAQIPLIIKITQSKSAEDISIISPIMFLVSFSILGAISLNRRLYLPLLIFTIGIATSIILIIQVSMYEKSKNADYEQPNSGGGGGGGGGDSAPPTRPIDFQFPDPKSVYNKQS
jgi:uncharacterized protein with PQ loop repeat